MQNASEKGRYGRSVENSDWRLQRLFLIILCLAYGKMLYDD